MPASRSHRVRILSVAVAIVALGALVVGPSGAASNSVADRNLDRVLDAIVGRDDGPPGISVVVQRGATPELHTAGVADTATKAPIMIDDAMRLASVAKAFSGAAAVALVADGTLQLDDTVGAKLPDLPAAWAKVTLGQLLQHTSGIPDFSDSPAFRDASSTASLTVAPRPAELLSYVAEDPLGFTPGTKYKYSNSDNVVVGLMVQGASNMSYEDSLAAHVYVPLGLANTSLPVGIEIPSPTFLGYALKPPAPPVDVTQDFVAGWTWASGGVVSTPADANSFVRYASGTTTNRATQAEQFRFREGHSEPPGPGTNAVGMAIFRYRTRCGVVFGHTGNTAGYTQFVASTCDGSRSVVVSANAQITPKASPLRFAELRKIFTLGVCAALDGA